MNLIEAIKSGRPRRNEASLVPANREWHTDCDVYEVHDICADLWEIREPTVTITSRQFWDAVRLVAERLHTVEGIESFVDPKILASKLGLEAE